MFNNLIESSSHAKEFKRRGSFLLFTTATYVVLFAITGVISIYAYDAHLESQSTELELLIFVPLPPPEEAQPEIPNTIRSASNSDNQPTRSTRTVLMDSPTNPNNPPDTIGTVASTVLPARRDSVLGDKDVDPPGPPPGSRVAGTGNTPIEMETPPPPPVPTPTPVVPKILKISTVINSRAVSLPRPSYPKLALQIGLQGTVTVQVLIDEDGRVLSAKGTGHPLLVPEAEKAAKQARFSQTMISGVPVKVSGVITYNFVKQ
ncbi:MAG TPA: energy transducer TonB [Pyrinomonadaceae bacterium]|nr:energy transducer TonB [Pyrinomonadaceae bacterium]